MCLNAKLNLRMFFQLQFFLYYCKFEAQRIALIDMILLIYMKLVSIFVCKDIIRGTNNFVGIGRAT